MSRHSFKVNICDMSLIIHFNSSRFVVLIMVVSSNSRKLGGGLQMLAVTLSTSHSTPSVTCVNVFPYARTPVYSFTGGSLVLKRGLFVKGGGAPQNQVPLWLLDSVLGDELESGLDWINQGVPADFFIDAGRQLVCHH